MRDKKFVILAADDEVEQLDALELFLLRENLEVYKAHNGTEALRLFAQAQPDIVLLDIMMPEPDGFSVLKEIRKKSRIPAIMMTARDEDYDKILGLELGADDYVTKPYNPLELTARVKAQLRRSYRYLEQEREEDSRISLFDLTLDTAACLLTKAGEEIKLTRIEYKILELLMKNPGRIYTKQQIFSYVWDEPFMQDDSTVMVHISNLRGKIGDNSRKPERIMTIKGLGYKFAKEK